MQVGEVRRCNRLVVVALKLYDKTGRNQLDGIIRHVKQCRDWTPRFVLTEDELERRVAAAKSDGVAGFVVGALADDEMTRRILKLSLPTVLFGKEPALAATCGAPVVIADSDAATIARAAARHLLSLGTFRTYAYVRWPVPRSWCRARERVFREELAKVGHGVETFAGTDEQGMAEWVASLSKPAAVFAACDRRAIEVFNACYRQGIDVPGQVAILGVDNDELYCESSFVAISSIEKDDSRLGYLAARRLSGLLRGSKRQAASKPAFISHKFAKVVTRESTAHLAPAVPLVNRAQAFIRENATDGIGVTDVVRHLGVSRRLADRRFREVLGRTIRSVIEETRLSEVKRLLSQTDRSMEAIASMVGYRTSNHLKKTFKRVFGVTMTEYRDRRDARRPETRVS